MKLEINFIEEIKKTIISTKRFENSFNNYNKKERKYCLDEIICEILYVLQTGISWRNYRGKINYNSLYYYFKKFVNNKIIEITYRSILDKYYAKNKGDKLKYQFIDTTIIKNKLGEDNISINKYFKNKKCMKISLVVDINGIPFSVLLDNGSKHDLNFVKEHFDNLLVVTNSDEYKNNNRYKQYFMGDKGYVSKDVNKFLTDKGYKVIIPTKKNMKNKLSQQDKIKYKKRIKIENTFCKIKQYKRLDTRYDRLTRVYSEFLYLSLICILVKQL